MKPRVLCQTCCTPIPGVDPKTVENSWCSDACYDAWDAARDSGQQEIDTDERLQVTCRRWQERLRLSDWRVSCRLVAQEVVGPECDADVQFCREHRTAEIRIVGPAERTSDWRNVGTPTVEHSLVHELLHLFFVPADALFEDEGTLAVLEQAINAISEALVG